MTFSRTSLRAIAVCAVSLCATASWAHITLADQAALAGTGYRATLRVGHGCDGSPTSAVRVSVPAGLRGAKPMPKPGWTIAIEREKLAQPRSDHGKTITEEVRRIRWSANTPADALPGNFYDEFVLQARMPEQAGTIYWPVEQICEQGRMDWTEVPTAGQKLHELKSPAAALELLPAAGGHSH